MVSFISIESCGTRGRAPRFNFISWFVVDGKGLKMSKSLGNVIAPEDILKNRLILQEFGLIF